MSVDGLVVLLVPAVVSGIAIEMLRRSRWTQRLADVPNERSLHERPKPRVGGLGLMAGALPVGAYFAGEGVEVILGCAAALALVSFRDDLGSLPIHVRLPAHVIAATIAVLAVAPAIGFPMGLLAVLVIAWMTNLFNFMDGADGLAGGMAAFGFAALAAGAALSGATALALVCAAIASASIGFLIHNFPPARVFLGDAGSIPLGFLAGALSLYGMVIGAWAVWFPLLVFSPFIVDATATLARRALRGEAVWRAHRSHHYQRLVMSGWSHRRLALAAYALMAAATLTALAFRWAEPMLQCGIIAAWGALYALLLIAMGRYLRFAGGASGKPSGPSAGQ
jgi:UDP-N-acetylmuramyl pentapeptide phosphotransferase/UDP-N-acetylglucosamine-1-phosphate transferase